VLIEIRPTARLTGKQPIDVGAALNPVLRALVAAEIDLQGARIVCDWIQYRNNFREPVEIRRILGPPPSGSASLLPANPPWPTGRNRREYAADRFEVAVDLRRASTQDLEAVTRTALWRAGYGPAADVERAAPVLLEDYVRTSRSCLWEFNAMYWRHLQLWERATGRGYESALPGGVSDARNTDAAGELIDELFAVWDQLADRAALPEELYVVELGVGNGEQARAWLDTFHDRDAVHGRDYYRRLRYLMCDYSPHVLELARTAVRKHQDRVSSLVLDAVHPLTALAFLRAKLFLVYVSNVYDNLPSDEIISLGQRHHLVESRAYLPAPQAQQLADSVSSQVSDLPGLVRRLLRLGPPLLAETNPDQFTGVDHATGFWRDCWAEIRLQERYVPLPGIDTYTIAEG
jgi:hypothetical protein